LTVVGVDIFKNAPLFLPKFCFLRIVKIHGCFLQRLTRLFHQAEIVVEVKGARFAKRNTAVDIFFEGTFPV
jgi:hypothetical protein